MATHTTYSNARANLAAILDRVGDDHEIVIINRRGAEDVALVAAKELSSLVETAHLLRSPANARRLLKALDRAKSRTLKSQPLEKLRREMGLAEKK
jgi:prevent-host-death family protein